MVGSRGQYDRVPGHVRSPLHGTSGIDVSLGARAIKRLVIGFLVACVVLFSLHASKDRISSLGYRELANEVPDNVEEEASPSEVKPSVEADVPEMPKLTTVNAQSCDGRRTQYRNLLDARSPPRNLQFDATGELAGGLAGYSLSQSQTLSSKTCWSSQDRYGLFAHPVDGSLNACNALLSPKDRTAIVLRLEPTNLFTDDAVQNLRALIVEAGWFHGFDVILLQHVDANAYDEGRIPAEFRDLLVNFRADQVFDGYPQETEAKSKIDRAGLRYEGEDGFRYVSTFYHFPQTWFFRVHKEYRFAYFLDSHVRHTGNYGDLFGLLKRSIGEGDVLTTEEEKAEGREKRSTDSTTTTTDLVTLDPMEVTRPSVLWDHAFTHLPESYYRAKFIVHGMSRRFAAAMNETLWEGVNAPHDGFLPAVAVKHGLSVAMLAHPVMKRKDAAFVFERYAIPDDRAAEWRVLNLDEAWREAQNATWQHGGTFAVQAVRWMDDAPQVRWLDETYQLWKSRAERCLPGLLIYPVSGR